MPVAFQNYFAHLVSGYDGINWGGKGYRYVLDGTGKRLRPRLVLACCDGLQGSQEKAFNLAAAIELVHTYSLIHDDLPLMDNDDMRRGRPSAHKVFGDAQALLLGDGLLTDAFGLLATAPISPESRIEAVRILASACGSQGMVAGQYADMCLTGQDEGTADSDLIRQVYHQKTGRLFGAAAAFGGIAAGSEPEVVRDLEEFGCSLGIAYQIRDDLIDADKGTGKTANKDISQGKNTLLRAIGKEAAQAELRRLMAKAHDLVRPHGRISELADEIFAPLGNLCH